MAMSQQAKHFYEFGPFRIDSVECVLLRDGAAVPLTPKVFDILLMLVENRGQVVEKDKLISAIWPDSFVEEGNLTQNISTLRKALGEGAGGHTYIQTIARRGYRFVGSVREIPGEEADSAVEERSTLRLVKLEGETDAFDYAAEAEQAIQEKALTARRWETKASKWRLSAVAMAVFVMLLAVAVFYFRSVNKPNPPATAAHVKTIAVLPFKPLAADSRNESLELGMADTLITKLRVNMLLHCSSHPPVQMARR